MPNHFPVLVVAPHPQPGLEGGIRYSLDCELCANKVATGTCAVQVQFSGTEINGHQITWSSPWQTGITRIDNLWRPHHFSEDVPEDVIKLENLEARVNIVPYDEAARSWNAARAQEQIMQVRNLSLKFAPLLDTPNEPDHNWLLF